MYLQQASFLARLDYRERRTDQCWFFNTKCLTKLTFTQRNHPCISCPRAFFIQRETKAAVKGYNRCSLERVPNRAPVVTIVYDDLGLHN